MYQYAIGNAILSQVIMVVISFLKGRRKLINLKVLHKIVNSNICPGMLEKVMLSICRLNYMMRLEFIHRCKIKNFY